MITKKIKNSLIGILSLGMLSCGNGNSPQDNKYIALVNTRGQILSNQDYTSSPAIDPQNWTLYDIAAFIPKFQISAFGKNQDIINNMQLGRLEMENEPYVEIPFQGDESFEKKSPDGIIEKKINYSISPTEGGMFIPVGVYDVTMKYEFPGKKKGELEVAKWVTMKNNRKEECEDNGRTWNVINNPTIPYGICKED